MTIAGAGKPFGQAGSDREKQIDQLVEEALKHACPHIYVIDKSEHDMNAQCAVAVHLAIIQQTAGKEGFPESPEKVFSDRHFLDALKKFSQPQKPGDGYKIPKRYIEALGANGLSKILDMLKREHISSAPEF